MSHTPMVHGVYMSGCGRVAQDVMMLTGFTAMMCGEWPAMYEDVEIIQLAMQTGVETGALELMDGRSITQAEAHAMLFDIETACIERLNDECAEDGSRFGWNGDTFMYMPDQWWWA